MTNSPVEDAVRQAHSSAQEWQILRRKTGQALVGWKLHQHVGWMARLRGQRCRPELGALGMAGLCSVGALTFLSTAVSWVL